MNRNGDFIHKTCLVVCIIIIVSLVSLLAYCSATNGFGTKVLGASITGSTVEPGFDQENILNRNIADQHDDSNNTYSSPQPIRKVVY